MRGQSISDNHACSSTIGLYLFTFAPILVHGIIGVTVGQYRLCAGIAAVRNGHILWSGCNHGHFSIAT